MLVHHRLKNSPDVLCRFIVHLSKEFLKLAAGPGAGWIGIIGGIPYEKFRDLPAPGGFTQSSPAAVYGTNGAAVEVFYGKGGKRKIRKIKKPKEEEHKISLEEAMETPEKMFKYLKQYNKRQDKIYEEKELNAYKDEDT